MHKIPYFTAYPISSVNSLVFIVSDRYLRHLELRDKSHKLQKKAHFALYNSEKVVRGES